MAAKSSPKKLPKPKSKSNSKPKPSAPARSSSAQAGGGEAHVALLRGINVGGKNILPMKDLAALFERLGCGDVRTYIQSGNVVYQASAALAAKLPVLAAQAIDKAHGLTVPVVTRSAPELASAVRKNPFLAKGDDPEIMHLAFLAAVPEPGLVGSLDPARSPPDEFALIGRDLYLKLPKGAGQSKLTNQYFDSRLKTVSTVRNWRTVLTLLEMCGG